MKTIAILQLLLTIVSSRLQQVDEQRYYIYNVTSYYCIHKSDAFRCTKFNKFVKDNDGNYMIFNTKASHSYSEIKNLYSAKDIEQVNVTFCKSLEKTDVTKNTLSIYLHENFCRYTYEKLRNGNFEIWTTDTCLDSYQAKKQKSRRDESKNTCKNFTLPVQKKLNLANGDVCKATESLINYTLKYYDILDEGYNKASDMKQVTSDMVAMPKTWYIYKYILSFAVYYEISRFNKSCTSVERNEQLLYECKCKLTSNLNKACKEIIKYNLRASITKPNSFLKTFLNSVDTCSYMQKWDEGYKKCDRDKCVIVTSSVLGNLTLKGKEKLCNKTIWITDSDGFVASERKLQYIYEPDFDSLVKYDHTEDDLEKDVPRQENKINEVQKLMFYISVLLIICVLWYIFNTVVNFYSLWKLGQRRRIKNKLYFMNCFSRSLTSRYVYFHLTDNFNNEIKVPNEGLYEYIEE